uniref:Uncharacterized protein n=1 Tax=Triticum urartu TaxID=4572 RepID=A0A8R7Q3B4_TRIUA
MQICMLDVQPHQLFGFLHRICILSRYLEAFSSSIFHRLLVVHSKSCLLFYHHVFSSILSLLHAKSIWLETVHTSNCELPHAIGWLSSIL